MQAPPQTDDPALNAWMYQVYTDSESGSTNVKRAVPPGSGDVITYSNQYLWIKYADTLSGEGMSNNPTNKYYWGVSNKVTSSESTVATDYLWSSYPSGFSTNKELYLINVGYRSVRFNIGTTAPTDKWIIDPGAAIDLDSPVLMGTVTADDINVSVLTDISNNLGTPLAGDLTFCTGIADGLTAGTVLTNADMTGAITSVGNDTALGSFTSLQLKTALTDETGSGAAVFATSPTLVTPALGTPSALVGTNITGTAANLTAGHVTTNANLTGEVTSLGNAATVTNSAVISKVLTGYVAGAGTITATDTVLTAIQKLQGNTVRPTGVDYIDFTPIAVPSFLEGRVWYDTNQDSLNYYDTVTNLPIQMGRVLVTRCYKGTGATIPAGAVVYLSGASGITPAVTLARADVIATSDATIGLAGAAIPDGTRGLVWVGGSINNVDTSAYTAGQPLYLSGTTAGGVTNVEPLQPNYSIRVGYATAISSTVGKIYVHVERGVYHSNIETVDTASGIALPTTPTVYKPATTVAGAAGITYDSATGIYTFLESKSYTVTITVNATASASNKTLYYYGETNYAGSGWTIVKNSGRSQELLNNSATQMIIILTKYFPKGLQARFFFWADATITLNTTNLPGTTAGTVIVPAFRTLIG